jgi:hypothetical protein
MLSYQLIFATSSPCMHTVLRAMPPLVPTAFGGRLSPALFVCVPRPTVRAMTSRGRRGCHDHGIVAHRFRRSILRARAVARESRAEFATACAMALQYAGSLRDTAQLQPHAEIEANGVRGIDPASRAPCLLAQTQELDRREQLDSRWCSRARPRDARTPCKWSARGPHLQSC